MEYLAISTPSTKTSTADAPAWLSNVSCSQPFRIYRWAVKAQSAAVNATRQKSDCSFIHHNSPALLSAVIPKRRYGLLGDNRPMRFYWMALFVLPLFGGAAELQIDHVTVAGRDLKRMQAALSAVGILSQTGGQHTNHATEMALTSFPDGSYLELIAIQPNADPAAVKTQPWAKFLQSDAGPCAWAVRTADVSAEVKRLKTAGIQTGDAQPSGRQRPDGFRLEWETVQIGPDPRGSFFPFLIHDFTPRRKRAYPAGKPAAKDFSGVIRVVIAVRDLDEGVKRFQQAYGIPKPIKQVDAAFGAHLALLGGTPVILAAPSTQSSWLAERLDQFGEAPCAIVLGARNPGRYRAPSKTRWFGRDVSWLDTEKLGWKLGFE